MSDARARAMVIEFSQLAARRLLAGEDAPDVIIALFGAAVSVARAGRSPGVGWSEIAELLAAGLKSITDQISDSDA